MDERFIVKVTPAFNTVNLHDPCIVYLSWIPDHVRLSTLGHMSLIFIWLLPFPYSSRESAVLLNMPATHIYPYANTGLHTYRPFPEPRRDKSDTREAFVSSTCRTAVTAEQTVPRLCFDTDTRAPTQTLYSPKVCCHFFTLFVKALFSPFRALPQLPNGSCTVSCLCLAFSAKKGLLFVFLLHKLHFKSHESKMYRGLHSQAVQI